MNVPGIAEFLSSRMVKSPQLSSEWLRTNDLNADKKLTTQGYEYALGEFPIWANKVTVLKELLDENSFPRRIRLCYFDIPNCADTSKASDSFFNALSDSENLDIFNIAIINIIVTKAWMEMRWFFFWSQMLP